MKCLSFINNLRQSITSKFDKSPKPIKLEHFDYEDDFDVITLVSGCSERLTSPIFKLHDSRFSSIFKISGQLPLVLDYHGCLALPESQSHEHFKTDPERSSVYLEYRIRSDRFLMVILKITGITEQEVSVSFDGREDVTAPLLVFVPKSGDNPRSLTHV